MVEGRVRSDLKLILQWAPLFLLSFHPHHHHIKNLRVVAVDALETSSFQLIDFTASPFLLRPRALAKIPYFIGRTRNPIFPLLRRPEQQPFSPNIIPTNTLLQQDHILTHPVPSRSNPEFRSAPPCAYLERGSAAFDVILKATFKTIPPPSMLRSHFEVIQPSVNTSTFWYATAYLHPQPLYLVKNGMMGYSNISTTIPTHQSTLLTLDVAFGNNGAPAFEAISTLFLDYVNDSYPMEVAHST